MVVRFGESVGIVSPVFSLAFWAICLIAFGANQAGAIADTIGCTGGGEGFMGSGTDRVDGVLVHGLLSFRHLVRFILC